MVNAMNKELIISKNEIIELNEETLSLTFVPQNDATIILKCQNIKNLNLNGNFDKAITNIIIINESNEKLTVNEEYEINGGTLTIGHGVFSVNDYVLNTKALIYKGEYNIHTYTLCKPNVVINQKVINMKPNTSATINNSCVALKGSNYNLVASGEIAKDAYGSKSLQGSKCLTFGELENVKVLPVLVIDENDVSASHSLSVGKMDEVQMFYLKSRGLNDEMISELVTVGYVMPLIDLVSDDYREFMEGFISRKVNELCLTSTK